jgi:hypothetical protein
MIYKILDMRCPSCATMIQMDLEDAGYECECSYSKGVLEVKGDHDVKTIKEIVSKTGYNLQE